jgi:hypothetical protein
MTDSRPDPQCDGTSILVDACGDVGSEWSERCSSKEREDVASPQVNSDGIENRDRFKFGLKIVICPKVRVYT